MSLQNSFNPEIIQDNVPIRFLGQLVYFKDIQGSSPFHELNDHMILVMDDAKSSNQIVGLCLDSSMNTNMHAYMKACRCNIDAIFNFATMYQGNIGEFKMDDAYTIAYLMNKEDADIPDFDKQPVYFGQFAAYIADNYIDDSFYAQSFADCADVIVINNVTTLKRTDLLSLIGNGKAFVASADPKKILQRSVHSRMTESFAPDVLCFG